MNHQDEQDDRDDGMDDMLQRVRATLAPLPAADPRAMSRVLSAVHGRTPSRAERWKRRFAEAWARPLAMGSVAAASLVAGIIMRDAIRSDAIRSDAAPPASATRPSVAVAPAAPLPSETAGVGMRPAGATDADVALPVQFVVDARTTGNAATVAVVGDFNDWRADSAPMQRLPGTDLWTVTLAVKPGRHVYAFVVNGEKWIADPRAPRAPDADFGRPGSVLIVGAP